MTQDVSTLQAPAANADIAQWLDYQLALHAREIDLGLARVTQVAQQLGVISLTSKVITVGGTNGKGTTCRMLEEILLAAGYSVGVYSSPHLIRYNERIRINRQDVDDAAIVAAFEQIEQARGATSLTFFEFGTLAALVLFKQQQPDVVILEVGLGGRLDATNIVDSDISAVTSIDLDHQAFLGNTREQVGYEKAGIFRFGCPAIVGEPNMPATVNEVAHAKGAFIKAVGLSFNYQQLGDGWQFDGEHWHFSQLPLPQLPLPNAATTLAILEQLLPDLPLTAIQTGLAKATLTGRMEHFSEQPLVILDVAHNPHAARYLAQQLAALLQGRQCYAICGMLKDKDIQGVLSVMAPLVQQWSLVTIDTERGATAQELYQALPAEQNVSLFDDFSAAWRALTPKLSQEDVVIVFGSFYTVSGFKEVVQTIGKE
ncbi:bifunctional tetrahydrofolate synthase/dihydrofolate synthase [Shewanella avicenniae]|uniref:Dihydrofolate synthase/folylpolyglutamate synthase n=1 Tax=Shewanella avicenniae TaxID=2814294 RepID=A0ABX7QU09_9GAMM|nr:bifunctional tetrahydrofolate synthase/dihydrofolate synthase [Shewanella avicenniae]QSX34977.1 bifunctional tetrahydrofolate synthase/dihydrofolate synthase [Shewanella avicenniae]